MFFHFSFFSKLVFASFLALSFSSKFSFGVSPVPLPSDEVRALREIAKTLGKTDWNFNVDPCSGKEGWVTNSTSDYRNNVTCDYNIDDVPHVVSISLRRQSLKGMLPPELVKLPYLQNIDLTRNYLNGTTPPGWSSMKLVNIILGGNRISGSIPKEFGNISTLLYLEFESNQLSGTVPRELGNLKNLEKLRLTSNYLSGELPITLANFTSLEEFWIGDNYFTGQIPSYIQNWKNLKKLFIQASGLNGSIPSGIAALVNLTDLRISDMSGNDQPFPPLNNMEKLKYLILRSCNIADALPPYLGNMQNLITLDLSFNKLRGQIPRNYSNLSGVSHIYLTGNLLNGSVPEWTKNAHNIDLSYNNFTVESSSEICPQNNVTGIVPCLDHQCPKDSSSYSLNINCGGEATNSSENIAYEKDLDLPGRSIFPQTSSKWVFRSTGHFMDVNTKSDEELYINSTSASRIHGNNSELYRNARISAISLAYYGLCLGNGKYAVNLHFAEIMFSDGETYGSLGRRIFDIYIQGKLVKKDFNIAAEAGGVNKPIKKTFSAVVTHNVLEIRFYWAGRGTTSVPSRGIYGPLISAISAVSEHEGTLLLPVGEIVGIAAAVAAFILLVLGVIFWWKGCIGKRNAMAKDQETGSFTLKQIKAATSNFNAVNKIGEGGFGPVYKGVLSDGTMIAVKMLSSKSKQGHREFMAEIGLISALEHPNLVELYGCCNEGDHLLLVYEYLENNSLARALFGSEEYRLKLEWPTRHMICVGIARGLAYLHEESRLKIVHRDIKATNVLLDKDLNPKISDFGLAKLNDEENTHISTRIAGTLGYMAPEYALHGYLTDKADVYSFGIVALEIVCGKSNATRGTKEDCFNLLDWATNLKENGSQMELVDPRLGSEFNEEEAMDMINVALVCTNISPSVRPTMSSVVSMLEGKTIVPELASDSSTLNEEIKFMAMKKHFKINEEEEEKTISDSCRLHQNTIDGTSASDFDLYPISVGS